MSGASQGNIEFVIALVGAGIAAVLLVIALILLVSHRQAHRTFGVASIIAAVVTVGVLSFV